MLKNITTALSETSNQASTGSLRGYGNFTQAFMESLTKLAYDEYKYNVYTHANRIDKTMNEWLYDMVWYTPEPESLFHVKEIHLVVESEWSTGKNQMEYDFYKLIQARAKHRLFIFQAKEVEERIAYFKNLVKNSTIAEDGDSYLFACWNDVTGFTFSEFRKGMH